MHLPDTWNHEEHESSRCEHPRNIAGLEERKKSAAVGEIETEANAFRADIDR